MVAPIAANLHAIEPVASPRQPPTWREAMRYAVVDPFADFFRRYGVALALATLAFLLILTTPWPYVLKAMRTLGVPVVVVAMLGMTHRYIFVLLQTATQMFEARRSRLRFDRFCQSSSPP